MAETSAAKKLLTPLLIGGFFVVPLVIYRLLKYQGEKASVKEDPRVSLDDSLVKSGSTLTVKGKLNLGEGDAVKTVTITGVLLDPRDGTISKETGVRTVGTHKTVTATVNGTGFQGSLSFDRILTITGSKYWAYINVTVTSNQIQAKDFPFMRDLSLP